MQRPPLVRKAAGLHKFTENCSIPASGRAATTARVWEQGTLTYLRAMGVCDASAIPLCVLVGRAALDVN
jgi:hypothetical protein